MQLSFTALSLSLSLDAVEFYAKVVGCSNSLPQLVHHKVRTIIFGIIHSLWFFRMKYCLLFSLVFNLKTHLLTNHYWSEYDKR